MVVGGFCILCRSGLPHFVSGACDVSEFLCVIIFCGDCNMMFKQSVFVVAALVVDNASGMCKAGFAGDDVLVQSFHLSSNVQRCLEMRHRASLVCSQRSAQSSTELLQIG